MLCMPSMEKSVNRCLQTSCGPKQHTTIQNFALESMMTSACAASVSTDTQLLLCVMTNGPNASATYSVPCIRMLQYILMLIV